MTDIAISVQSLSKCYQIYENPQDRIKQFVLPRIQSFAGKESKQYYSEFWAVEDVSFEIKKGEAVGIVGRNGSGKSTLLQLICGTLSPTIGSVQTNGRLAALLELGSGFNPEFTGRENIYMNAAVLGLSKDEIDARYDNIVAFADIGQYIEQAVKTYSSGMVVRLAFSVAISVEPDILIVDEALSVGDELFQRKCFSRIEAIRANGATILLVSHSGATVVELCDRAVLMDFGEMLAVGTPKKIVNSYQKLLYSTADKHKVIREQIRLTNKYVVPDSNVVENLSRESYTPVEYSHELIESFDPNLIPSSTIEFDTCGAYIESPVVLTLDGDQVNNLIRGKTYCYTYTVKFTKSVSDVKFGMKIKTISGVELGGVLSKSSPNYDLSHIEEGTSFRVLFHFRCILNQGVYFLNAGVADSNGFLHRLVDVAMFRVMPDDIGFSEGIVDFSGNCELESTKFID